MDFKDLRSLLLAAELDSCSARCSLGDVVYTFPVSQEVQALALAQAARRIDFEGSTFPEPHVVALRRRNVLVVAKLSP